MSLLKRIRHILEILLTRVGILLIPRLPRPVLVPLGRFLGGLGYYLAPRERRNGRANLELAFGEALSAARKEQILKASFRNFGLVLLDIFWFTRNCEERLRKHVRFDNELAGAILIEKPQLCVTGHLGNWEILGQAVSVRGFPLHSVAAPLKNPAVEALFTPMRIKTGQMILHKQGVLRTLLKVLRDGKKVGILLDQNTPPAEGGLFVPFFGIPVPVSSAPAALAVRTNCEVLFAFCIPGHDGGYRAFLGNLLPPREPNDATGPDAADRLTGKILRVIESVVRENPEHWLWMYKRWKLIPPGHSGNGYPSYAKPLDRAEDIEKSRVFTPGD